MAGERNTGVMRLERTLDCVVEKWRLPWCKSTTHVEDGRAVHWPVLVFREDLQITHGRGDGTLMRFDSGTWSHLEMKVVGVAWLAVHPWMCSWLALQTKERERSTSVGMCAPPFLHQRRYCLIQARRMLMRCESDKGRLRSVGWTRFKMHWKMIPLRCGLKLEEDNWFAIEAKYNKHSLCQWGQMILPLLHMNSYTCWMSSLIGMMLLRVVALSNHSWAQVVVQRNNGSLVSSFVRSNTCLHVYPRRVALIELYGYLFLLFW